MFHVKQVMTQAPKLPISPISIGSGYRLAWRPSCCYM